MAGNLGETSHFPMLPTLTLDDGTGARSKFALQSQRKEDGALPTAQRADGIDREQVRLDAADKLLGGTLSTLRTRDVGSAGSGTRGAR
jgi:hypothetical protein